MTITADELRECVRYEPETGDFIWLTGYGRRKVGTTAPKRRYLQLGFGGKLYYAHRLAWLYVHGHFPEDQIDHINGDPSDNRLVNLRVATPSQNSANRPPHRDGGLGLKGVTVLPSGRYQAKIKIGKEYKYIGSFDSSSDAHEAYRREEVGAHGVFAWSA